MSETANPRVEAAETLFKDLLWDRLIDASILALQTTYSWLLIPGVKQISTYLLRKFADKLFDKTKLVADIAAIRLLNTEHAKELDAATVKLKLISMRRGTSDPAYLEAKDAAKDALSRFTRFGVAQ